MEVKLLEMVADDGNTYQAVVFKDTPTVSDENVQALIDAAKAEAEAARVAQSEAEEAAANAAQAAEAAAAETAAAKAAQTAAEEERDAAIEECMGKHFVTQVTGPGTEDLTVPCPFEPDTIFVTAMRNHAAVPTGGTNPVAFWFFDRTCVSGEDTFCGAGGFLNPTSDRLTDFAGYGTANGGGRYSRDAENGTITISGVNFAGSGSTAAYTGIFDSNLTYTVICEKHT